MPSGGAVPAPDEGQRARALLPAVLVGSSAEVVADAWSRWRSMLPDLDLVSAAEVSLLPAAWQRAEAVGVSDPDAPRLHGLQRLAAVHTGQALARARQVSGDLQTQGIDSVISGPLGAALLGYPSTRCRRVQRVDLIASAVPAGVTGSAARWRRRREPGAVPVVVRWGTATGESVAVSGDLPVAAPHVVAYWIGRSTVLTSRPGEWLDWGWLVDIDNLARRADFDEHAFGSMMRRSGLAPALSAHIRELTGLTVNATSLSPSVRVQKGLGILRSLQKAEAVIAPASAHWLSRLLG